MAIQLGLSEAADLALRHGGDRRHGDRRAQPRGGPDRRCGRRRRLAFGHALLTSLTLGVPSQLNPATLKLPPSPAIRTAPADGVVSVTIDSAVALPPRKAYDGIITDAAARYGVEARLIRAVMQTESAFNPFAVSRAGAMGLMQIMPALVADYGVSDPFDPRENIMAGSRYLKRLLLLHDGDLELALASYTAGATTGARYGGVPPFVETQNYIKRIVGLLGRQRA